ncbi:MAG TPA: hypothetical protein VI300_05855 [Solirubrobacter sp.]
MDAEERHRAAVHEGPSLLEGVSYDAATGAYDLHRFVESPTDASVGRFIAALRTMTPGDVGAARSALSMDDLLATCTSATRRGTVASCLSNVSWP